LLEKKKMPFLFLKLPKDGSTASNRKMSASYKNIKQASAISKI
jgi:hypothetical protein